MKSIDALPILAIMVMLLISVFIPLSPTVRTRYVSVGAVSPINITGADFAFTSKLLNNNDAVGNGTGVGYSPGPPVAFVILVPDYSLQTILSVMFNENGTGLSYPPPAPITSILAPDYLYQKLLKPWNYGGNGSGYPPPPPVNYIENQYDYITQIVLSLKLQKLNINLTLTTNTTSVYVDQVIDVNISAYISSLGIPVSNGTVEIYDVMGNSTSFITRITLDQRGKAKVEIKLGTPGDHTLYAVLLPSANYNRVESNRVVVEVDRIPTKTTIFVPKTTYYYNETIPVTIKVYDILHNRSVSDLTVILHIINNSSHKIVKEILNSSGIAKVILNLSSLGNYTLYAEFQQQSIYQGSVSSNVTITVTYLANPMGGTPIVMSEEELIPIILVAVIIVALTVMSKIRKMQ